MATTQNVDQPFSINLLSIFLYKFNKTQGINILPQMAQLNIYQSMFQPTMHAELLVIDAIGLFENFPMIGEETIEINYRPTRDLDTESGGADRAASNVISTLRFMVNSVQAINPDAKGRSQSYILKLYSLEMRENSRKRIQRAFNAKYSEAIEKILQQDLVEDKLKIDNSANTRFEETKGVFHFIVPNIRPLGAINWMVRRAVPANSKASAMFFYETFNGFYLKAYESLIEEGNQYFDQPYPSSISDGYDRKKYIYIADNTQAVREAVAKNYKIRDNNFITGITLNRRWNSAEKATLGYFENEFFDIDILNKKVVSTKTKLEPIFDGSISKINMNTKKYIEYMQNRNDTGDGVKNRVRYVLSQNEGDQPEEPRFYKDKFGEAVKKLVALGQVSVNIDVPGDTRLQVGDLIEIILPNMTGYNKVEQDKWISGRWIVANIKHTISMGNKFTMTVEIHKDSYDNDLNKYLNMIFEKGTN